MVSILSEELMVLFQILPSQFFWKTLYFINKPLCKSKIACNTRINFDVVEEALDLAIRYGSIEDFHLIVGPADVLVI